MQRLAQERRLAVGEAGDRAHADALDRVARAAGVDGDLECRAAEPVEQETPERLETRVAGDAEADQQLELALGLEIGAAGHSG